MGVGAAVAVGVGGARGERGAASAADASCGAACASSELGLSARSRCSAAVGVAWNIDSSPPSTPFPLPLPPLTILSYATRLEHELVRRVVADAEDEVHAAHLRRYQWELDIEGSWISREELDMGGGWGWLCGQMQRMESTPPTCAAAVE